MFVDIVLPFSQGMDLKALNEEEKSNCEMKHHWKKEDQEANLLKNANANGYQKRKVDIPGDGNCLFHAVADQVNILGLRGHTHVTLRKLAVQELQKNMVDSHVCCNL